MFIFNFKINKNLASKLIFIVMLIIIIAISAFGIYIIFFKNSSFKVNDTIQTAEIFEVNEKNYTNILRAANDDVDSYVGLKVHIIGYVYRLLDFEQNQFVIARDMLISDIDEQSLVVGFLCEYSKALDFKDGTWVDVIGEIKKKDYHGSPIAMLDIISICETSQLEDKFVDMPDENYIPTSNMF